MTAKIIASIVVALGLGFGGTYFATTESGSCSGGGCPISMLLGSKASTETATKNADPDCCFPGSPCCTNQGGDCCLKEKEVKISTKAAVPDCCFPGSPCCEGDACCLTK